MIIILKRFLASNKYFWKFRHFFQKNVFNNSYGSIPVKYFDKIFKEIKIDSVLDFGCASGDKLCYFLDKGSKNIFGIDINKKALSVARSKIKKKNIHYKLINNISKKEIKNFLKKCNNKKFDLIIFDRVLYILNDDELFRNLKYFSKITDYIYVDDFFFKSSVNQIKLRKNIGWYKHTDFNITLKKLNFDPLYFNKSPYKKVKNSISKSVLYKRHINFI